ncbi:YdcF family protein [Pedobacter heparinus]|uniref:YdcF family protein n=1 Tax=Pedobacter heparinus TaxID=984 RepID=UPI0029310945|nr:YdcF family protein [Pedobacter heparinus]
MNAIAFPVCENSAFSAVFETPKDSVLVKRIFTLLYLLDKDAASKKSIKSDKTLNTVAAEWQQRLKNALNHCDHINCLTAELKLKDTEIRLIGSRLAALTESGDIPYQMIKALKTTNAYFNDHQLPDSSLMKNAWNNVAKGINRILEVYLSGKKPRYPAIDSISFNANSPEFLHLSKNELSKLSKLKSRIFYELPLQTAFKVLTINGRIEAARYEPLTSGLNAAVFTAAQHANWSKYPYTAILVPGFGPEEAGIRIDHRSIARSKMAAERFKKGLAPFIIVSGGHVYPAKTPYCEAIEMKKYMVEELGLPADAIIIEPYARHTTTNVRNASRIVYRFNMPQDKPVLVVTDPIQTKMVINLAERCKRELGYIPFHDVKKLNEQESSFHPVVNAFQADVNDPLDP